MMDGCWLVYCFMVMLDQFVIKIFFILMRKDSLGKQILFINSCLILVRLYGLKITNLVGHVVTPSKMRFLCLFFFFEFKYSVEAFSIHIFVFSFHVGSDWNLQTSTISQ